MKEVRKELRIVRIIIRSTITVASILLVVFFVRNYRVRVPAPLPNVPVSAMWIGGSDGGSWFELLRTPTPTSFKMRIYHDYTGEIVADTVFILNRDCQLDDLDSTTLMGYIEGYDGERIMLKGVGGERGCYLSME